MTILDGYGSKPTTIRIDGRVNSTNSRRHMIAELWIDQLGASHLSKGKQTIEVEGLETLAYMTLEEVIELRDECNSAIQGMIK